MTDAPGEERPPSLLRRREARAGRFALELPISKQFTPVQIDSLQDFLRIMRDSGPQGGGSSTVARERVRDRFFAGQRRGGSAPKRLTAAGNAIGSARHWGLLNDDDTLTSLGGALLAALDDNSAASLLATNFLRHLGGAAIVKAIFDIIRANDGVPPVKEALAQALHELGVYENSDGTDHSAVLRWLAHPGVGVVTLGPGRRWGLDETEFNRLAGVGPEVVDGVVQMDEVQIALLVELARAEGGTSDAGRLQQMLGLRPDLEFSGPRFRQLYIDPLVREGLVVVTGRGARGSTRIAVTDLGRQEVIADLVQRFDADGTLQYLPADLMRPTREIVADLDAQRQPDRNRRGAALEQLALRIASWIGLHDIEWRARPDRAEEIDGVARASRPTFARWQIQAKNTAKLTADDAAKEVGLAVANGASVVMLITTGEITAPARDVVRRAEQRSAITLVCLDGADVKAIAADSRRTKQVLDRERLRTMGNRET